MTDKGTWCGGTGEVDSGGFDPQGHPISIACECQTDKCTSPGVDNWIIVEVTIPNSHRYFEAIIRQIQRLAKKHGLILWVEEGEDDE